MSICIFNCEDDKSFKEKAEAVIPQLVSTGWDFLTLKETYKNNSLEEITATIPFRNNKCVKSPRCCGDCSQRCPNRCLQDCLHRLHTWKMMVESTPEELRNEIPLGIRMAVKQKFTSPETLSMVVGEIISSFYNPQVKEYLQQAGLKPDQNPYKMDYGPKVAIDPSTGRRMVEPETGRIKLLDWPQSGLCPYCLPKVTVDRRYTTKRRLY